MTDLPRTDSDATLVEATDLLNIELPDRRWRDESHLQWLYGPNANPYGPGIYGFRRAGERLDAHYGLIPQSYRTPDGPMPMMFSLNAVTRNVAQRLGHFWSIAEEVYARALDEYGAQGIIGVSNDNSTPPVVKRLGWRLMGPLPVKVVRPLASVPGVVHHLADAEFLTSLEFEAMVEGLDQPVEWGWRNRPTPEYLQWRLSSPNTEPFHLHVSDDLVAVSVPSHLGPAPVAVIVKLMPRRPVSSPRAQSSPIDAMGLIGSICRHHRAPFAVYAGFNDRVRVRGVQPPRRVQPAPLNLIYRPLTDRAHKLTFRLETFEFLDMDAY